MNDSGPISATFIPVVDDIDFNGPLGQPLLLMSTASARIYRVAKAGKMMLLKTPIDQSGRSLELLKREYTLGVGLSHPNVAAIFTWESSTPVGPGILMEYVDGRTLNAFIAENPTINARRRVFGQLLDAVNYIHKHGVTHNDLKPGNIMVNRANDDVKIIDFGLADADGEAVQRQLGGTEGYASPELSARDRSADMRSDIYSVGVIMHEMFGNRYRRIWRKCIAENPRRRYRNIDALIKAWHLRAKLPTIIWSIGATLTIGTVLAFGVVKIANLRQEVERYSRTSTLMTDSLTALRSRQADSADSLARLNLQLNEINRTKATRDSLAEAYMTSCRNVTERYKGRIRKMRCVEETYAIYQLYHRDMDRNDSLFLRANRSAAGHEIFNQFGMSMRLKGITELETMAKQLPLLNQLTSDIDQQSRLMPLILSGQPWSLPPATPQ